MNSILVVNVNWVGDVIFSTPVFKALKKTYPKARVSALAVPRVKEILESCPFVDEIIIYDEKGAHKSPFAKLKLIRELKTRKFDIAFLLHRSLTRAVFVFLAGIPKRVGYDTKGRGFLLTHKVKPRGDINQIHRCDYYLNVIESFGVKAEDRTCEIQVSNQAHQAIVEVLKKNGIAPQDFLVVVNTGGNWDLKRWPKANFARLIDRLNENHMKVVIPGAMKDQELAEEIAKMASHKPLILTGQTSLTELAALLKMAQLVIAADTGPLHLANCVGTRAIGLFGPTRPEVTGPQGKGKFVILQNDVGCNPSPCYRLDCPSNVCMQSISVEDVIREVQRIRN